MGDYNQSYMPHGDTFLSCHRLREIHVKEVNLNPQKYVLG